MLVWQNSASSLQVFQLHAIISLFYYDDIANSLPATNSVTDIAMSGYILELWRSESQCLDF